MFQSFGYNNNSRAIEVGLLEGVRNSLTVMFLKSLRVKLHGTWNIQNA
jgi:hypothetical protein